MIKRLYYGLFLTWILTLGGCTPTDFETCEAQAAKDAKTNQALSILVSKCGLDFPARKRPDGTYAYYDAASEQNYLVKGAKVSAAEWEWIEQERKKKKDDAFRARAEYQQKREEALKDVSVSNATATCVTNVYCSEKVITATIKNGSKYRINRVAVGWVMAAGKIDCTRSMSESAASSVNIPSGGNAVLTWGTRDGPHSINHLCLDVVGVGVGVE